MKTIFENESGRVIIDDDSKMVILELFKHHKPVDVFYYEHIKKLLLNYTETLKKYNIHKTLYDFRNLNMLVDEEFMQWVKEKISSQVVVAGLNKAAFVMPQDTMAKLDLKFIIHPKIEEVKGPERKLFESYEQALDWLKNDED